jgi:hypothetical protein
MDFCKISSIYLLKVITKLKRKKKDGREIYLVTQTFKPSADNHLAAKNGNIVEQTFLIGCSDHLLYGFTSKLDNGTMSEMTVKTFNVLNELSDDVFDLPSQQFICTNGAQYAEHILPWVKKVANSPSFKAALLNDQKKTGRIRYIIVGIMLISPILLGYYLLRHNRK